MSEPGDLLIRTGVAGAAALLVLLALRWPWRRAFGAATARWPWVLLPVVLLAVLLPPSQVRVVPAAVVASPATARDTPPAAQPPVAIDAELVLLGLWVAGVLLMAAYFIRQQRHFQRCLGRLQPRDDGAWQSANSAMGPALVGLVFPKVVLPADFEQRYSPQQRELVLAHERNHRQSGDVIANALFCAGRCLFWFDPLWHLAASRLRFDQELACDAAVLSRFPDARRAYADAVLNTQSAVPGLPAGCAWQSSHPLVTRIAMLRQPAPSRFRLLAAITLALNVCAGGGYAAWAAQPPQVRIADAGSERSPRAIANGLNYAVNFKLDVDGERSEPELRTGADEPILLRVGEGERSWDAEFRLHPQGHDTLRITGELRRGNSLISSPDLEVRIGSPFVVEVSSREGDSTFRLEGVAQQLSAAEFERGDAEVKSMMPRAIADSDLAQRPVLRWGADFHRLQAQWREAGHEKLGIRVLIDADGQFRQVQLSDPDAVGANQFGQIMRGLRDCAPAAGRNRSGEAVAAWLDTEVYAPPEG